MTGTEQLLAYLAKTRRASISAQLPFWPVETGKPKYMMIRDRVRFNDGTTASIQYGATHYCDGTDDKPESVEMWRCPHHPALDPYGDGEYPYANVPIDVVGRYIEAHGGIVAEQIT